jgi:hypothetical protein
MIALLRQLVLHDFWLKLFSLALAVLIWVTLSIAKEGGLGNRTSIETYHLPIRVVSSSTDVSGFRAVPDEVRVRVRGVTRKLQDLQAGDIRALVEVTGGEMAPGLRKRIGITTHADLTILEIVPEEAEIIEPPAH